jgi:hypothetical protein
MIRDVHPGSRIQILIFFPSRIQRSKNHEKHQIQDPDPQHCLLSWRIKNYLGKRNIFTLFILANKIRTYVLTCRIDPVLHVDLERSRTRPGIIVVGRNLFFPSRFSPM